MARPKKRGGVKGLRKSKAYVMGKGGLHKVVVYRKTKHKKHSRKTAGI